MTKLQTIEGIGDEYARRLVEASIDSVEALLQAGSTPAGRKKVSEDADVSGTLVLEWVNRADLYRVPGIQEEYSDLLEAAGVDTVPELAQRNPDNLFDTLQVVNEEKKLVRRLPSRGQVANWVASAKELPRIVTY